MEVRYYHSRDSQECITAVTTQQFIFPSADNKNGKLFIT